MGLLGMLAAGGAVGAMNASNANVEAQNRLEIDQAQERMRESFYNRRYKESRADTKEDARSQALLNAATYERTRTDKLTDDETKHTRGIEIEGIKSGRSAASNAARIQAAEIRRAGAVGKGGSGIMLPNGLEFKPNSPEGGLAADAVNSGMFETIPEAMEDIRMFNLIKGVAGNAMMRDPQQAFVFYKNYKLSQQRANNPDQNIIQETTRDPKTGRLILK